MALRLSTGLRNQLLGTDDFKTIFTDCFINIYAGTQPTSADTSTSATLLCTIYSDGSSAGLEFDAPASGAISKAAAETWSGTAAASGTAAWFRLYEAGDTPGSTSTSAARIDGTVGVTGGDMNISSTTIASGAVQTVTSLTFTLPAS